MASAKEKEKASTMAASGKSAAAISKKTGIGEDAAKKTIARATAARSPAPAPESKPMYITDSPTVFPGYPFRRMGIGVGPRADSPDTPEGAKYFSSEPPTTDTPEVFPGMPFSRVGLGVGVRGVDGPETPDGAKYYTRGEMVPTDSTSKSEPATSSYARPSSSKKGSSLGQAIKIAASNDGAIGGGELRKILGSFDVGSLKIQNKVDKINSKLGADNGFIGFKSGAWNGLSSGKFDTKEDKRSLMYGRIFDGMFGKGAGKRLGFGSRPTTQKIAKGITAFTPPGMDTMYRETKGSGGWDKYFDPGTETLTTTDAASPLGGGDAVLGSTSVPETTSTSTGDPTSPVMPDSSMFGSGGMVDSRALSFKRASKSRDKVGKSARGYGSFKTAPSWATGVGADYR